ncbi:MAG: hypothetical protein LBP67_03800 [Bacteroidales bacterium]|jgi:hypothetical protein|nr:hypothetical protein [Bacteroidales bacterium]
MKAKLILSTVILVTLGILGFCWLHYLMPQYYFNLYPLIPAFYVFILLVSYIVLLILKKKKSVIDIKTYAIIRAVKFVLCLVFVIIYLKVVNVNNIAFVMVFMLFYVIYLILESWLFMKISKS